MLRAEKNHGFKSQHVVQINTQTMVYLEEIKNIENFLLSPEDEDDPPVGYIFSWLIYLAKRIDMVV